MSVCLVFLCQNSSGFEQNWSKYSQSYGKMWKTILVYDACLDLKRKKHRFSIYSLFVKEANRRSIVCMLYRSYLSWTGASNSMCKYYVKAVGVSVIHHEQLHKVLCDKQSRENVFKITFKERKRITACVDEK